MPQLTRNARKALDQLLADIADIADLRREATEEALDQKMVKLLMGKIENAETRMRLRIEREIKPLLVRQAPQYEARLAKVEEQLQRLMDEMTIDTAERAPSERRLSH